MKKIIALLLVSVMALGLAACGNTETPNETTTAPTEQTTVPAVTGPASALEVLETIWASYGEDEKFFAMGGDYSAPVDGAPGAFSTADPEAMTSMLLIPADSTALVAEAASLVHGMNLNNFTCGVYGLTEGTDAKAFADTMRNAILNNPWMCGFPEHMVIANVGGYVLVAFGINDAINPFEAKLTAAYPTAEILYSEALA